MKILNDLAHTKEGRRLYGEEWIFKQDNAAIHNASISKKYLVEKKRLLGYPACFPDLNSVKHLWRMIVAKVYEGGQYYSAISEFKKAT